MAYGALDSCSLEGFWDGYFHGPGPWTEEDVKGFKIFCVVVFFAEEEVEEEDATGWVSFCRVFTLGAEGDEEVVIPSSISSFCEVRNAMVTNKTARKRATRNLRPPP